MSIKHVIGIVAPSSPVPDGLIKQSVEYFHKLGFKVKTGKHLDKKELFAAGSDEKRAADNMDFIKDPYIFDFLIIGDEAHEREVEKALVHLCKNLSSSLVRECIFRQAISSSN